MQRQGKVNTEVKQGKIPSLERQMKGFFYQQSHTKSHMKTPSTHVQEEWMMAENC